MKYQYADEGGLKLQVSVLMKSVILEEIFSDNKTKRDRLF